MIDYSIVRGQRAEKISSLQKEGAAATVAGSLTKGRHMDLGIEGRTAIVCASSQGLGFACAEALALEGVDIILNGRDQAKLDAAAAALRNSARGQVIAVAADVTTVDGQQRLLAAHPA